jgi:hypothetical protein
LFRGSYRRLQPTDEATMTIKLRMTFVALSAALAIGLCLASR